MKQTKKDNFSNYHPLVGFYYFIFIMGSTMLIMHPVALLASILSALFYSTFLKGKGNFIQNIVYIIPSLIAMALINPAFNHEGATILLYFKNGNPLTLESVYYGIFSATLLLSTIIWFSCFNIVMTSDKIIYLFGRILPISSLLISMSMRFVPLFRKEIKKIADAQRCIGVDISNGSILQRCKNGLTVLSVMIGKSLENSIETSDSMKSRGYGLSGRTSFSIYKITKRDIKAILILLFLSLYVIIGIFSKALYARYFPTFNLNLNYYTYSVILSYTLFALFPLIEHYLSYLLNRKRRKGETIVATDQFTL